MNLRRPALPIVAAAMLAVSLLLTGAAQARSFSGFNDRFNLGRSANSGAVCQAQRSFDDPVVDAGGRAWDVTCRGWSQKLGTIYVFGGSKASKQDAAWRALVGTRAECAFDKPRTGGDLGGAKAYICKSKPAGLDYVAYTSGGRRGAVAAEGLAPIADVLATGVKYVSGHIAEPAAIAEQTASVSQAAGVGVSALTAAADASKTSAENRRQSAYRRNQEWQFDDAEAVFAELATPGADASSSPALRAEALYNFALNVSNKGRFAEADVYFGQADALVAESGLESSLGAFSLNYKAAHARNQRRYEEAIRLAEGAVAARTRTGETAPAAKDDSGAVRIAGVGAELSTIRLSSDQRNALRDVQALQIEATSLEALGKAEEAREVLARAVALLDRPLLAGDSDRRRVLVLADGSPWLNTRVRADILRLDRNIGRAAEATPQFQLALDGFSRKYPGSLPLAGFLVELARAQAAAGQDDRALTSYETAFDIFRRQRGSIEASADLVGTYFDILLRRIGTTPEAHAADVERYFTAAQTLVAQSSAEAAKRQAARIMAGDTAAAGLARALDDTNRRIDAAREQLRDLQQRGLYQGDARTRIDTDLQALVEQNQALEQQLLQADPRYASSLRSLVSLPELQKALRGDEVYVKVFLLANRGYGLLVSPTQVLPYAVELSREKAQTLVDGLRKPIDQGRVTADGRKVLGRYDVALARTAFLKLLGPVQDQVLAAKHLIYEPDATLIGAPIAALVVDDASVEAIQQNLAQARASGRPLSYVGVNWLGGRVASSVALGPAAFVQIRSAAASKAPEAFFGFGDPLISQDPRAFARVKASFRTAGAEDYCAAIRQALFNLSPLPQTADEVKVIAASLGQDARSYRLGADYTDAEVMRLGTTDRALSRYRVIYFATHGILPPPNGCLQSALVTSLAGDGGDGLIDVSEIPQLSLDADMVVLSACDTGRGSGGGGEALGGLVETFVQAGARNVVVSNWSVDTVATERLMTSMFATKGVSQADALAAAERALMASPDQYSHPFYWAAFTVVGDGARSMPAT